MLSQDNIKNHILKTVQATPGITEFELSMSLIKANDDRFALDMPALLESYVDQGLLTSIYFEWIDPLIHKPGNFYFSGTSLIELCQHDKEITIMCDHKVALYKIKAASKITMHKVGGRSQLPPAQGWWFVS